MFVLCSVSKHLHGESVCVHVSALVKSVLSTDKRLVDRAMQDVKTRKCVFCGSTGTRFCRVYVGESVE